MSTEPLETPMWLTGMIRLRARDWRDDVHVRADTVIRVLRDHNRGYGSRVWVRGSDDGLRGTEHSFVCEQSQDEVVAEVAKAMTGLRRHAELMRGHEVPLPSAGPAIEAISGSAAGQADGGGDGGTDGGADQ